MSYALFVSITQCSPPLTSTVSCCTLKTLPHIPLAGSRVLPSVDVFSFFYAASVLLELRKSHRFVCEKHFYTFDEFLLTKTPQNRRFSLTVKKMHLNTMILLSVSMADKKNFLPAPAKARVHCVVYVIARLFALRQKQGLPASAAERSLSSFNLGEFCRLRVRLDTTPSRLHFGADHHTPFAKKVALVFHLATRTLDLCCTLQSSAR